MLIVGAGGHSRSCIDIIHASNKFTIHGLIGFDDQVGQTILGYQVIGSDNDLALFRSDCEFAFIAIGQIKTASVRQNIFSNLRDLGYSFPTFVSSRAYVSPFASIGAGTIVMPGGIIGPGAKVGENCIINSQALIEHDVLVDNHVHISTGAKINGGCKIGSGTFVGSGAVIKQNIKIGKNCIIGAGVVLKKNLSNNLIIK